MRRVSMKRALIAALAAASSFACNSKKAPVTIPLGSVLSTSGDLANVGTEQFQAAKMAIDEINAAGGVLGGQQLGLENRDDASEDAVKGKAAAQELLGKKVVAMVGAVTSGVTLSVAEATIAARVPLV